MDSYRDFIKYSLYLVIFSLVWMGVSAFLFPRSTPRTEIAPAAGFKTPAFTLNDLEGRPVSFDGQAGKPAIISLWATWCPPCKAEMPILEKVYREYRDRGLIVYAVDAANQDALSDVRGFVQGNDLTFPILMDTDGSVAKHFAMRALPTTFFIAPDGTIHQVMVGGPFTEAFLRSQLTDLFAMEK